jgi:hypothetical protein
MSERRSGLQESTELYHRRRRTPGVPAALIIAWAGFGRVIDNGERLRHLEAS